MDRTLRHPGSPGTDHLWWRGESQSWCGGWSIHDRCSQGGRQEWGCFAWPPEAAWGRSCTTGGDTGPSGPENGIVNLRW